MEKIYMQYVVQKMRQLTTLLIITHLKLFREVVKKVKRKILYSIYS